MTERCPADAEWNAGDLGCGELVGVVDQKHAAPESIDDVAAKIDRAIDLFGGERVLLHPDCGFTTFADNPICSASSAEAKLAVIAQALDAVLAKRSAR